MAESEEKSEEDLTMEEILSSIRKIISEDEEATGDAETEVEAEVDTEVEIAEADEAEVEAEAVLDDAPEEVEEPAEEEAVEEAVEEEDVLDLTDVVEEEAEPEIEDLELSDEEEPAPVVEESEPEAEVELTADDEEPFPKGDGLLSPDAAQRTSDIIDQLAVTLTSGYEGDGRTLEGLVRAMLKPMLKEWLDVNLPDIVQRSVEGEIARLTRYNK